MVTEATAALLTAMWEPRDSSVAAAANIPNGSTFTKDMWFLLLETQRTRATAQGKIKRPSHLRSSSLAAW
ncbi:Uncharacterised protein [Mycobacterium tuberculosis]|nr:Uncharacterised protein [Mycobacterium tuberculosis]